MMTLRMELFVNNLAVSSDFYCRILGFEKEKESERYIAVKSGNAILGLGLLSKLSSNHPLRPKSPYERVGGGVEIVLEIDDIETYYQRIVSEKYPIQEPLQQRSWGLTDFRIIDPDGYYLRITSKNKSSRAELLNGLGKRAQEPVKPVLPES